MLEFNLHKTIDSVNPDYKISHKVKTLIFWETIFFYFYIHIGETWQIISDKFTSICISMLEEFGIFLISTSLKSKFLLI